MGTDDVNKGKLVDNGVTNGTAIAACCCAFVSLSTLSDVDMAKGGNVRPLRLRNLSSVETVAAVVVADVTAEAESPSTGKRSALIPTEIQECFTLHNMQNQRHLREIHPTSHYRQDFCCQPIPILTRKLRSKDTGTKLLFPQAGRTAPLSRVSDL
jgi:hypothetical protein